MSEQPFHLTGNYGPVQDEVTALGLAIEGAIPPELNGLYVRNGSNPPTGDSPHWFFGAGMLHGVRLEAGRVAWYRNRYVRTLGFEDPTLSRMSDQGESDRRISAANTHVLRHGGKILALEEGSFPWVVNDELETLGHTDFDGRLTRAFTAHPKLCPVTGEMLGFGYDWRAPYLTYYRVSPQGELVQIEAIDVPGPTMMHDFAITTNYVLFLDLPIVFEVELAMKGQMPFQWSDDYGARIGIMPRKGGNADVHWFEVDPCYIFHGVNAFEDENGEIVYDASRASEMWRKAGEMGAAASSGRLTLHRFRFDLKTGGVREETLEPSAMDFAIVAPERVGRRHRHSFFLRIGASASGAPRFKTILKRDFETGTMQEHPLPDNQVPTEVAFVPAAGSDPSSDEGWLLAYVHDEATEETEFRVLDASDLLKPAIARVKIPQRVPYGFHGSWIPDAAD
jgi:carotenoid cleavage dioxygenase